MNRPIHMENLSFTQFVVNYMYQNSKFKIHEIVQVKNCKFFFIIINLRIRVLKQLLLHVPFF